MAKFAYCLCLVIVAMDIVAGILGIQAQLVSNKFHGFKKGVDKELRSLECIAPNREAFMLGIAAASLFALAHISANLLGGCICISSVYASSARRKFWILCLVSTWIMMGIGFPMVIHGVVDNSEMRGTCMTRVHNFHFLSAGAIFCFLHSLCFLAFYVLAFHSSSSY